MRPTSQVAGVAPTRKRQVSCAIIAVIAVTGLSYVLLGCFNSIRDTPSPRNPDPYYRRRFEATAWKAAPRHEGEMAYQGSRTRQAMARDLMDSHLRKGMSRAQVVALLGEPNGREVVNLADPRERQFYEEDPDKKRYTDKYWLGFRQSDMDGDNLWLNYDASDRLVGIGIL